MDRQSFREPSVRPHDRRPGEEAYDESRAHADLVVCLLPSRTDTGWWHDYWMKGEIQFIRGRLKFGSAKNSAPFPRAVVYFRNLIA
jgi:hypothetical protein